MVRFIRVSGLLVLCSGAQAMMVSVATRIIGNSRRAGAMSDSLIDRRKGFDLAQAYP
ncbi:MAG: hypothetical protein KUG65_01085 [Sphingomonadaceae bacterium]|nr:hypothetical protein [Sphingomonadaceae bacterium]